ncbi:MAG: hypothetical protein HPY74_06315 [Firmicutes bacterium]|nr:hypothetical protein [Bacillota bacterium]
MLMNRDIIFCLAFLDTAKEERDIAESAKFQSNIAKYSIVELYKKLKIVVECIGGSYPDTTFVYQKEQKGTENAARIGYSVVEKFNIGGPVIITMGDKISDVAFIRRVLEKFHETGADLVLSAQPKEVNPTRGRIVVDEGGKPIGIVEEPDTKKALIYKRLKEMLETLEMEMLDDGAKREYMRAAIEKYATGIISGSKKRETVMACLADIYGNDKSLINERIEVYLKVLRLFAGRHLIFDRVYRQTIFHYF